MPEFDIIGEVNLLQVLVTSAAILTAVSAWKPLFRYITAKFGIKLVTTASAVRSQRVEALYHDLMAIYTTTLTGKPVDYLIIRHENELYHEYKRLGGNGFIDVAREQWLEATVAVEKNRVKRLGGSK
jgi:hypothetical protein